MVFVSSNSSSNSPSSLKSGDIILKINKESTIGMTIDDAVAIMRGKVGTPIDLTIVRKGEIKPLPIHIVRGIISIQSVYARSIGKDTLYIRVTSFDQKVAQDVTKAINDKREMTKGIVLDLRETATIEATLNESLKNRPLLDVVVLLSSITGENPELEWPIEENVIRTNVLGWSAVALWAARHFERQGKGHLVGITSLAKYLASVNPSYIASKAFEGKLLDGLRLRLEPKGIWVTEILPGFVETPMIARQKRKFWAISAEKAAHCILGSIEKKKRRAVISKRWKIFRLLAPHISARLQLKIFKL